MNELLDSLGKEVVLRKRRLKASWRYSLAIVAVLVGAAVRMPLKTVLGTGVPFITFYPAVAVVAMIAGARAGLAATLVSALVADWLFIEPHWGIPQTPDLIGLILFIISGVIISATAAMVTQEAKKAKLAGEELRESEGRLRALVTATSDVVYQMSPDWQEMRHLQGREFLADTTQASRNWLEKYIFPEDRGPVLAAIEKAIQAKSAFQLEHRVRRVDGSVGWTFSRAVPILNASGQVVEWFGAASDVTERKKAEQRLTEQARLLDLTYDAIMVRDKDDRIRYWNRGAQELYGFTPQEALGNVSHELLRTEFPEPLQHLTERLVKEGRWSGELVHRSRDGRRLLTFSRWVLDATLTGAGAVLETNNDITDQKLAEERLKEAKQRLEAHVENSPLAMIEFDPQFRVIRWSEEAKQLFGWRAEEVLGRAIGELRWVYEEDAALVRHTSEGMMNGRTPRNMSANRNYTKDGRVVHCEWYNSAIYNSEGRLASILSQVLDVTERKRAQEVLARGKEELERIVAERTAQLRDMVGELEHFSYTITHDMRAPLRAMRGFAEAAVDVSTGKSQESLGFFLDRIMVASERMDALITDALNYSKVVRTELPLGPVDVSKLLRGILNTYPEFQAAEGKIFLQPDLPRVMGNEAGLTQCFSNLLGNALKFTRPGAEPDVRIRGEQRDGWVRLWVEDHGVGIPKTMLPRVFQMFSRGAHPKSGTGIGLALVRKAVERMGGRVGVESEEGKGSRFWLELRPERLRTGA